MNMIHNPFFLPFIKSYGHRFELKPSEFIKLSEDWGVIPIKTFLNRLI
jgi:hypothetical protein